MKREIKLIMLKIPKVFKSVRYMLAAVNGFLLLIGILLLLTGVTVLVLYSNYDSLITRRFFTLPGFVIGTGVLICLVTVLGFYGAISEQFYFIAGYVVSLLVLLIFEVAIIIVAFGLYNGAASDIRSTMSQTLQLYESRLEVARTWDDLQMDFECCGVTGRSDWGSRIPVSCCHVDYGTVSPFHCTLVNAYTTGCASVLGQWLANQAFVIAVSACVVIGFQVVITAIAGWLAWRSRFEEVELES